MKVLSLSCVRDIFTPVSVSPFIMCPSPALALARQLRPGAGGGCVVAIAAIVAATPATISQFVAAVSWSCSVARPAPAQLRILRINIANLEQVCRYQFQFQQMWRAAD